MCGQGSVYHVLPNGIRVTFASKAFFSPGFPGSVSAICTTWYRDWIDANRCMRSVELIKRHCIHFTPAHAHRTTSAKMMNCKWISELNANYAMSWSWNFSHILIVIISVLECHWVLRSSSKTNSNVVFIGYCRRNLFRPNFHFLSSPVHSCTFRIPAYVFDRNIYPKKSLFGNYSFPSSQCNTMKKPPPITWASIMLPNAYWRQCCPTGMQPLRRRNSSSSSSNTSWDIYTTPNSVATDDHTAGARRSMNCRKTSTNRSSYPCWSKNMAR